MDEKLVPLITQEKIAATVGRLAREIDGDYQGQTPVVVAVLKGSFMFLADLLRMMETTPRTIEFLRIASYGTSTESSRHPRVLMGLPQSAIENQHVLLVEDIVDTGITTSAALRYLCRRHPASIKLCTLLDKPARRRVAVDLDYLGLTIPNRYVVGYGLDLNESYRHFPAIYAVE